MDLIDGLRAFVATAQTGSFTEAAERLGISNRLSSKYVAELESRVGARLLQRTTRKVGLTPSGQELLARAPALLDELDDMLSSVASESQGLSGVLRISAPVTFGEIYVQDLLSRFADLHPGLSIDLRLNDAHVDLAKEGFDLAFRLGLTETSSLKLRSLSVLKTYVLASPKYLAQHGKPQAPQDLSQHQCIFDTNRRDAHRWTFTKDGEQIKVRPNRQLMVNSAKVAKQWALQGKGIVFCPEFVLEDELKDGRLLPLLQDYQMPDVPLCAVYLVGNILPRKVRALIDFAVEDTKKLSFT